MLKVFGLKWRQGGAIVSWMTDLIQGVTIEQAKAIVAFVGISDRGRRFPKMSITGCEAIEVEWIGWDRENLVSTHCRVFAVSDPEMIDVVLALPQLLALLPELRSEINRAFDKPEQSAFRQEGRS